MSKTITKTVDKKIELLESLATVEVERLSYYFGRKQLYREVMKATAKERNMIRKLGNEIEGLINDYLAKPSNDIKDRIIAKKKELEDIRKKFREKASPYYEKIRNINTMLKYYNEERIPEILRELGFVIVPTTDIRQKDLPLLKSLLMKKEAKKETKETKDNKSTKPKK